jgi:hypothetical protein
MTDAALADALATWLARDSVPELAGTTGSDSGPTVSGAAVTGPGREEAMQHVDNTLQEFIAHHDSGMATILETARKRVGWDPTVLDDPKQAANYAKYISDVADCPLLTLEEREYTEVSAVHNDFKKLIDDIAALFDGLSEQDIGKIKKSLQVVANTAASSDHTVQKNVLLTLSVVDVDDEIRVYIYSTNVQMRRDSQKGGSTDQTSFKVLKLSMRMIKDYWPQVAESFWKQFHTNMSDWLDKNKTPSGPNPTNLCVGIPSP